MKKFYVVLSTIFLVAVLLFLPGQMVSAGSNDQNGEITFFIPDKAHSFNLEGYNVELFYREKAGSKEGYYYRHVNQIQNNIEYDDNNSGWSIKFLGLDWNAYKECYLAISDAKFLYYTKVDKSFANKVTTIDINSLMQNYVPVKVDIPFKGNNFSMKSVAANYMDENGKGLPLGIVNEDTLIPAGKYSFQINAEDDGHVYNTFKFNCDVQKNKNTIQINKEDVCETTLSLKNYSNIDFEIKSVNQDVFSKGINSFYDSNFESSIKPVYVSKNVEGSMYVGIATKNYDCNYYYQSPLLEFNKDMNLNFGTKLKAQIDLEKNAFKPNEEIFDSFNVYDEYKNRVDHIWDRDGSVEKVLEFKSSNGNVISIPVDLYGYKAKVPSIPGKYDVIFKVKGSLIDIQPSDPVKITISGTIPKVGVESVALDKIETTLTMGTKETDTLTATVLPENSTNKDVSWKSSNEKVVKVDKDGKLTALGAGTAAVTVKTKDGNKTASCAVTVVDPRIRVSGVTLDNTKLSLKMGQSGKLTAKINPDNATNKDVEWKSLNEKVVKVGQNGEITTVGIGTAVVTVTTKDGSKTAKCNITVEKVPVENVTLDKTEIKLTMGTNETDVLTAIINPSNVANKDVIWKSNNEKIVKVDKNGKLTAVAAGNAVITVTTVDGKKTVSCAVTVVDPRVRVTGVELDNTKLSLKMGQSGKLTAIINPNDATNKGVVWKSLNEKVVKVGTNGEITTVGIGNAVVTVTTIDGKKTAKCNITVEKVPVERVELNKTEVSLIKGQDQTYTLIATVYPDNATNKEVTWKSNNEKAVKVDKNGKLTVVGSGTATITVTTKDQGKTAKCTVTVSVSK